METYIFFPLFFPNNLTVIKFKDRDTIDSRHRPTYCYANTLQIDTSIEVSFQEKDTKNDTDNEIVPIPFISASCIDFWLYLLFFSFDMYCQICRLVSFIWWLIKSLNLYGDCAAPRDCLYIYFLNCSMLSPEGICGILGT